MDDKENDWGINFKIFKKKIELADSVDKRQFIKDGKEAMWKAVEQLYSEVGSEKGSEHTFVIKDDLKIDPSPTGLIAYIKGAWVSQDFVDSKLKKITQDLESKIRKHPGYHCPLCGKSTIHGEEKHCSRMECQKCGVYFLVHGIDGMDTRAGDSFSITYIH